jgi:hypothetical protein
MIIGFLLAATESRMIWSATITSTEQEKNDQHTSCVYLRTLDLSDIVRGFPVAENGL